MIGTALVAAVVGFGSEAIPFGRLSLRPYWPYFVAAMAVAIFFLSAIDSFRPDAVLAVGLGVGALYADIEYHHIPDWLTFGSMAAFAAIGGVYTAAGEAAVLAVTWILYLVSRGSFGGGDAKLLAAVSGAVTPVGAIWVFFLAMIFVLAIYEAQAKFWQGLLPLALIPASLMLRLPLLTSIGIMLFAFLGWASLRRHSIPGAMIPFGVYISLALIAITLIR